MGTVSVCVGVAGPLMPTGQNEVRRPEWTCLPAPLSLAPSLCFFGRWNGFFLIPSLEDVHPINCKEGSAQLDMDMQRLCRYGQRGNRGQGARDAGQHSGSKEAGDD